MITVTVDRHTDISLQTKVSNAPEYIYIYAQVSDITGHTAPNNTGAHHYSLDSGAICTVVPDRLLLEACCHSSDVFVVMVVSYRLHIVCSGAVGR